MQNAVILNYYNNPKLYTVGGVCTTTTVEFEHIEGSTLRIPYTMSCSMQELMPGLSYKVEFRVNTELVQTVAATVENGLISGSLDPEKLQDVAIEQVMRLYWALL